MRWLQHSKYIKLIYFLGALYLNHLKVEIARRCLIELFPGNKILFIAKKSSFFAIETERSIQLSMLVFAKESRSKEKLRVVHN